MISSTGLLPSEPQRRGPGEGDCRHRSGAVQHPLGLDGDALGHAVDQEQGGFVVDLRDDDQVVGGAAVEDMTHISVDDPAVGVGTGDERHRFALPQPAVAGDRRSGRAVSLEQFRHLASRSPNPTDGCPAAARSPRLLTRRMAPAQAHARARGRPRRGPSRRSRRRRALLAYRSRPRRPDCRAPSTGRCRSRRASRRRYRQQHGRVPPARTAHMRRAQTGELTTFVREASSSPPGFVGQRDFRYLPSRHGNSSTRPAAPASPMPHFRTAGGARCEVDPPHRGRRALHSSAVATVDARPFVRTGR